MKKSILSLLSTAGAALLLSACAENSARVQTMRQDDVSQEIAQGIEQIMLLNMDNVESITARPKCNNVIITALMNDGSTCSYLMSKDAGTSSISITAMNK